MIHTERLTLIPATPALLRAELAGRAELAQALDADVPDSWPPEFHDGDAVRWTLARLEQRPGDGGWYLYYIARQGADGARPWLIGAGGYKGAPEDGTVEIGYAIVPEAQRRGFATEAVRGLLLRAFADGSVDRVIAHTLPALAPSIGVLRKTGFRDVGPGAEPGTICFALRRGDGAS